MGSLRRRLRRLERAPEHDPSEFSAGLPFASDEDVALVADYGERLRRSWEGGLPRPEATPAETEAYNRVRELGRQPRGQRS